MPINAWSMVVNHNRTIGQQRPTVANDGQWRRSTTVNDDGPSLTTGRPPSNHRSTVVDRLSMVGIGCHVACHRARFTAPTGGYEMGESSVVAAARQIRPALTIDDSHRAEDRLIGRLRRERRYFRTLSTTYVREVAHSRDYYTQILDYCQSREVHTSTLVTQIEALQRDVSTLQE
nr:hypothetical protein [Tanacetum cinerariifolium]